MKLEKYRENTLDAAYNRKVILDTDMANEVDDIFALSYLLGSLEGVKLEAITIAPFSDSPYTKTACLEEGTELSCQLTEKILALAGKEEYKSVIRPGAVEYFRQGSSSNEAVEKIIEVGLKNEKTTILAIGAITNVALAILREPRIREHIEVIWLGCDSIMYSQSEEYNFRQDIDAVRMVYESGINLTVVPARNVASNLVTTTYELKHYLGGTVLGDYLVSCLEDFKQKVCKPEEHIGYSKVLWDLGVIAYIVNPNWFVVKEISCPRFLDDGTIIYTEGRHTVRYVVDLFRNPIMKDFFEKVSRLAEKHYFYCRQTTKERK